MDTENTEDTGNGLERLTLFSDGVFAIAITLLVLPLADAEIDGEHIGADLFGLLPRMLTFLLSFAVIGRYWMLHHRLFTGVVRSDGGLMALNLTYLFCIAFLPFPTAVLGAHGDGTAATVLYAVNLIAVGAASAALWRYVSHRGRLTGPEITPRVARDRLARAIAPTLALLPSVPLAFVAPDWAKYSWLLIIPFSMAAGRLFPHDV